MTSSPVRTVFERELVRITLARPDKRNALTRSMIEQLQAAVERANSDSQVRAVIIDAEGPVFCAGMDLGEMRRRAESENSSADWQIDSEVYRDLVLALFHLHCPTIACVQGPVLAGGVGIVLACDFVIASEQVFFALPEPQRGITAAMVTPLLLLRAGYAAATSLLLSGERCDAATASRIGLTHDVVQPDRLSTRVDELADHIMQGSPAAIETTKQHLIRTSGLDMRQLIEQSMLVSAQARESDDAREGLDAFLEKRPPGWSVRRS